MSDLLPLPSPPPPDPPSTAINGASLPSDPTAAATTSTTTTKRHRRPSVRLGDLTSSDVPLFRRLPKLPPLKTNPKTNPNPNRSRSKRPRPSSWTSKPADDVDDDGFRSEFDRQSQSPSPSGDRENGVHEVGVGEDDDDDVVVGVRSWLNRLGLGRYAPVFEIHEVDDEVLPLLTLEDLKDMGISAVGSRRKMFSEIQKLGNKNHNNF